MCEITSIIVIDALARARGERYATFDVVGAGPRIVAGICEEFADTSFYPYERAFNLLKKSREYDVVLISAMSTDIPAVSRLVSTLRNQGYSGVIVVGGPASFQYYDILSSLSVDYVIVGEAEIPLRAFLKEAIDLKVEPESIPALAYRDEKGVIRITSPHIHTPVEIMNTTRSWTRINESFDKPWVYRFYVEVVRGCSNFQRPMIDLPGKKCIQCLKCKSPNLSDRLTCPVGIPPGCGFCSVPSMFGPPRSKDVKAIVSEISELLENGARRIVLSAPDFLDYGRDRLVEGPLTDPCNPPPNIDAIEELLNSVFAVDEVKNKKAVVMIENIKACLVNEETGRVLGRYLRNTTVHIGLETACNWFNEQVLGKPVYIEHVLKASKILRDNGLRPYVYLMYGLPLATSEVYMDTLESISKLADSGVEKITLYKYLNLPGTAFESIEPVVHEDKIITELKRTIDRYNIAMKRPFIGRRVEAWAVETEKGIYAYPVYHGPVIYVKGTHQRGIDGCRVIVKIIDIGPRLVVGRLVNVLECPGKTRPH